MSARTRLPAHARATEDDTDFTFLGTCGCGLWSTMNAASRSKPRSCLVGPAALGLGAVLTEPGIGAVPFASEYGFTDAQTPMLDAPPVLAWHRPRCPMAAAPDLAHDSGVRLRRADPRRGERLDHRGKATGGPPPGGVCARPGGEWPPFRPGPGCGPLNGLGRQPRRQPSCRAGRSQLN